MDALFSVFHSRVVIKVMMHTTQKTKIPTGAISTTRSVSNLCTILTDLHELYSMFVINEVTDWFCFEALAGTEKISLLNWEVLEWGTIYKVYTIYWINQRCTTFLGQEPQCSACEGQRQNYELNFRESSIKIDFLYFTL